MQQAMLLDNVLCYSLISHYFTALCSGFSWFRSLLDMYMHALGFGLSNTGGTIWYAMFTSQILFGSNTLHEHIARPIPCCNREDPSNFHFWTCLTKKNPAQVDFGLRILSTYNYDSDQRMFFLALREIK